MNPRPRWFLLPLCALSALAILVPAAAAAPGKASAAGSLLYVQQTEGGSLRHLRAGGFELQLTGVSPRVSTFTDRPRRSAGSQPLRSFVSGWSKAGFAADPPNAALVLDRAPDSRDVAMLTLSRPRYDRRHHTLTYLVRPLHEEDSALAAFTKRADPVRAGNFGSAALFVDNGATYGGESEITVRVSNGTPGIPFKLSLLGGSWTVPTPDRGYGLAILSVQPMPLTSVLEAANSVTLNTTPEDGSLSFTLVGTLRAESTNPQIEFEGGPAASVIVTWPTAWGPQTQLMFPGDPLVLTGLVGN
jgi:hypothetical protein